MRSSSTGGCPSVRARPQPDGRRRGRLDFGRSVTAPFVDHRPAGSPGPAGYGRPPTLRIPWEAGAGQPGLAGPRLELPVTGAITSGKVSWLEEDVSGDADTSSQ